MRSSAVSVSQRKLEPRFLIVKKPGSWVALGGNICLPGATYHKYCKLRFFIPEGRANLRFVLIRVPYELLRTQEEHGLTRITVRPGHHHSRQWCRSLNSAASAFSVVAAYTAFGAYYKRREQRERRDCREKIQTASLPSRRTAFLIQRFPVQ